MSGESAPVKLRVVILISGRGSNMRAILDQTAAGDLPIDIRAVISNRPEAAGLEYAKARGIHCEVVDHRAYASREAFDTALAARIDAFTPDLLVLAGFMRVLTPGFVQHYLGRMLNIHPALLPKFPGLHTHQRALDAGETEHGASVHFVTPEVDGGPVVIQARVPVLADDDAATLAARVLEREHVIFPLAVRWFAEGRLRLEHDRASLDGQALPPGGMAHEHTQS